MGMKGMHWIAGVALGLAGAASSLGAQTKAERAYVFGNSLVHHLTDSDETSVPHWVALMAKESGQDFALSGQWGFLRDFAGTLPPVPNWSFEAVTPAWDSEATSFADAGLTSIWMNPANFIQYQAPDQPFDGDNPDQSTPIGTASDVINWVRGEAPETGIYIYEGWPEMAAITGRFPPDAAGLSKYHVFATGDHAAWYDAFVAGLRQAVPDAEIALIPVARVLSSVMQDTALSALSADTFYSDDAPHGTSALYLMAAMVAYNTIYAEPVPEGFRPPNSVAPELRATFPMVRDAIWERVWGLEETDPPEIDESASSEPAMDAGAVQNAEPNDTPVQITRQEPVENPSLAMGLNGVADWSVQHPFVDIMKTARPWVGHVGDQWGALSYEDIVAGGHLDEAGWPKRLPEGARALEAFVLTDQPEAATDLAGRYVVRYDGAGTLDIGGRAKNLRRSDGEIRFDYTPGEGLIAISISKTDPDGRGDYIRNIRMFRETDTALIDAGVTFNPAWIARIENLRSLRFMDWMSTNGSKQTSWDTRPVPTDFSYVGRGVPAEVMIELANHVGADPWFNMPHMADDDYIREFAKLTKDRLRPDLRAYVEYSNEVWNFIFPQAVYAQEQAKARWGRKAGDDAWMQYYGMRSAQMAQIWAKVYGTEAPDRLIPVIGTHTGWIGLEEPALNAPLWVDEDPDNNWPPYVNFSAYAVTGYFGYEMGSDEQAPQVLDWLEQSAEAALDEASVKGLQGAERDAYVETHKYDAIDALMYRALLEGSVKELAEVIFPQQGELAESYGLKMVMYEGGTHVAVSGEWSANEQLIAYFKHFNYTPEMAQIYASLMQSWKAAGGTLFNAFVDVAKPSQYGNWGALRHLQDSNPRWDVLTEFNATEAGWWEARAKGTFDGGRTAQGDGDANELRGTLKDDVLIGLGGDDVLIPLAGRDRLYGGDGYDAVLLRGGPADYQFSLIQGGGVQVRSSSLEVELHSVEMLWFEADENLAILVEDLL